MKHLVLLLVSILLFLLGLGGTSFQTYSHQAIAIVTSAQSYQRPDGNYVCDLVLSYNTNPFTLVHQVPLHTVSRVQYTFGQTLVIYYNPRDPYSVSISRYSPTSQMNLFFVVLAMAIFFLLLKR